MRTGLIVFFLMSIGIATCALAKEKYREAINAGSIGDLEKVSASVRKDMQPGGRYEYVSPAEKKTVDTKLTEMASLLQRDGSVKTMPQDQKLQLFNAQEAVNSILQRRDNDRVICKSEAPVGSHIPVTTCHTYRQEQEARNGAMRQMHEAARVQCVSSAAYPNRCGGS